MQKRNHAGFTLIELILVIIILGIISVVGGRILASIFNSLVTGTQATQADWEMNVAMERMARDLRAIPSPNSISNTSTASKFVYTDANDVTHTYTLSGTQLLLNTQVLADDIQSLAFDYYTKTGATISPPPTAATRYITITLTVKVNGIQFSSTRAVYPWNLQ